MLPSRVEAARELYIARRAEQTGSQFAPLLGCRRIPLARRVLYALATYTGQRKGRLFALRWKHADFDQGTLASFKTKTGRAQYFVADPGLMAVLEAWHAFQGKPGDDEPIVRESESDVKGGAKRIAGVLRADLEAAGATRAILFEDKAENVEPLRSTTSARRSARGRDERGSRTHGSRNGPATTSTGR